MPFRSANTNSREGHYIREWRKWRGPTQGELAAMVGTSTANISRIERGSQDYTQSLLEAIARALDVDRGSLLMRNPNNSEEIWRLWGIATPEQRRQLIAIAKTILKA